MKISISPLTKILKQNGLNKKKGSWCKVWEYGKQKTLYLYGSGDYIIERSRGDKYVYLSFEGSDYLDKRTKMIDVLELKSIPYEHVGGSLKVNILEI